MNDKTVGVDIYASTYSIGAVVFQLCSTKAFPLRRIPKKGSVRFLVPLNQRRHPWDEALIRIWPLPDKPFNWPPPMAFDNAGFKVLARRWHEEKPTRTDLD